MVKEKSEGITFALFCGVLEGGGREVRGWG